MTCDRLYRLRFKEHVYMHLPEYEYLPHSTYKLPTVLNTSNMFQNLRSSAKFDNSRLSRFFFICTINLPFI